MVNERLHANWICWVEEQAVDLHLNEYIEETIGGAGGERRDFEDAGGGVARFLKETGGRMVWIEANTHLAHRAGAGQIHLGDAGRSVVQSIAVAVRSFAVWSDI